ncbi:MAG: dihydroorotate dehydrogenase [Patescibacteria group bacterium]
MITMGRLTLPNPIIASSGALGFGQAYWWDRPLVWAGLVRPEQLGAYITKTLTSQPRVGNWRGWNPWQVLWPLEGGWVNALGLTNPGLEWFIAQQYPYLNGGRCIVSISDPDPVSLPMMAASLAPLRIAGIEVNISCPNTPEWKNMQADPEYLRLILRAIRQESNHPLIVKISYLELSQRRAVAEALNEAGIDAVDMINTIPFTRRFPNRRSPLRFGGGVSGALIQEQALEQVRWFHEQTSLPIIGGGGVMTAADVQRFLETGAAAVSIGSAHITRPWISTRLAAAWARSRKAA